MFFREQTHEAAQADLACLDHAYFAPEIKALAHLLRQVKADRFDRKGATGSELEWSVFRHLESEVAALERSNKKLELFDPNERTQLLYAFTETAYKLKAGTLQHHEQLTALLGEGAHLLLSDAFDEEDEQEEDERTCRAREAA